MEGKYSAITTNGMTCGLRVDGTAECQGSPQALRGFPGAFDGEYHAVSDEVFRSVDAGTDNGCGVRGDGSVVCWGRGEFTLDGEYEMVSVGVGAACGVRVGGAIECSGSPFVRVGLPGGRFSTVDVGGRFDFLPEYFSAGCVLAARSPAGICCPASWRGS